MGKQQDPVALWNAIRSAGGPEDYIEQRLAERGLAVDRRPTERMSKREKSRYKKALKAEAAARREIQSDIWEAYQATHIVHLGRGIFWNDEWDFDRFDHPRAEERIAENDIPAIESPDELAEALGLSIRELRWLTYHREAATTLHYTRFTIPKRNGDERAIWAPLPKLKAAQGWLLRQIVERLPVHGAAHGFVPGRSIYTNARRHIDSRIVLKMDVQDFFPTVTMPRVKGVFRHAGYREQIATLMALICTEAPREIVEYKDKRYYVALGPRCLPQGSPASPAITNTLCLRLDRRLTGLAQTYGWRYTRYADDLTFSLPADADGKPDLGKMIGLIHKITHDEGFQIHSDKTRVLRRGTRQSVTGLVVNGDAEPRVPRELRRKLRAIRHNLEHGADFERDDENLDTMLGYAAFVYMTDRELGSSMLDAFRQLGEERPELHE
jgi:retron-type reverse transcriptase